MNQKSEGKDKKSKNLIIIVVALVVVALIVSIIATMNNNDQSTPDQPTSINNTDQQETGTTNVGNDVESITTSINQLNVDTLNLIAEQIQALADGCGDNLEVFNAKITGFETQMAEMQTTLAAISEASKGLSEADLASIEDAWMGLNSSQETLEGNREKIESLSNTCNAE